MAAPVIAFIGLGLIGGSIAKGIKRADPDTKIMAYMRTRSRLEQAKDEGVIDVILDGIDEHLSECDLIFLCTPVEHNAEYLSLIHEYLKPGAIVTDVGSTKTDIHEEVIRQGMESCFIGGHPMAGSEKTGYENSSDHLLENAYYIITPTAVSKDEDIKKITDVAKTIGSIPIVMDYVRHDEITAVISHLPHIIASSLVNFVRDSDSEDGMMKMLAAGGFKDITRIASSSPEMWEEICMTNRDNLADILRRYICLLDETLYDIENADGEAVYDLFKTSRDYRNSFSDNAAGSVEPDYSFTVDIEDKPGSIAILSTILAASGVSIKNIGINHNREHGEGALRVSFYEQSAMETAWEELSKHHYGIKR